MNKGSKSKMFSGFGAAIPKTTIRKNKSENERVNLK